uniref:C-type lectin domain-containing protein n=2 Tax=Hucho hucho TaxID=62062 RepID=A0A4W5JUG5_9TELE
MADYFNKQAIELNKVTEENWNRATKSVKSETPLSDGRLGLYRLAAVCLGVLCVLQVILSISLRLAFFHSNRDREQLNGCYNTTGLAQDGDQPDTRGIMDLCTDSDQCRMNRNQLERERDNEKMDIKLLQESYTTLTTERDTLRDRVSLLINDKVVLEKRLSECGTGRVVEGRNMTFPTMRTEDMAFPKCPNGWRLLGSRCYFLSTEMKTWEESRQDCLERRADLVIINSREEQKLLYQLDGDTYLLVWIGLTDSVNEGTWKWVDGTPLTTSYWKSGQPDHGGPNNEEDCVEVYHRDSVFANWNDAPCDHRLRWICEKPLYNCVINCYE